MHLEYRLTFNDFLEANQAHLKSHRFLYLVLWVVSSLMVVAGLVSILIGNIWDSCYSIILGICIFPSFNLLQRYCLARTWKSQPSIREPITFEVTEEGLTVSSPYFQSNVKWQIYTGFLETKNLFMVYQSKQLYNLFPKRAFYSDEQINEFRELLRTMIVNHR